MGLTHQNRSNLLLKTVKENSKKYLSQQPKTTYDMFYIKQDTHNKMSKEQNVIV